MKSRTRIIAISLIVFLGILIRIIKASTTVFLSRDSYLYLNLIRSLNENHGFHDILAQWPDFWIPPIPLIGPVVLYQFINNYLYSGIIYNLLLGGIIIYLAFLLAEKIADTNTAFVVAIICATHPTLITYSTMIQRENSAIVFFLAALIVFMSLTKGNSCVIKNFLPGLLIGISALSRVEYIFYFFIICPFFITNKKKAILLFVQMITGCIVFYLALLYFDINIAKHLIEYF